MLVRVRESITEFALRVSVVTRNEERPDNRKKWKESRDPFDMPAAAPQVTRRRSSPLLRPRTRETALPDMPPSCTDGPSRPMERPAKVSSVPSQNLAAMMRPMTSASTCGMPLPEVAGSQRMSARTTSSMTRSASIQATMRATLPAPAPVICLRRRSAADSDRR